MRNYLGFLSNYHSSHDSHYIYFGLSGDSDKVNVTEFKGVGIELELDTSDPVVGKNLQNNVLEILLFSPLKYHYILEKDRSLSYGLEIITQPHTIEAMHDFLESFEPLLKEVCEKAKPTSLCNTAGLHMHFSKTLFGETFKDRKENLSKLIYFIYNHKDSFLKICQRTQTKYCHFVEGGFNSPQEAKKYVEERYGRTTPYKNTERHEAINLLNPHTVEIRIMGSILDTNFIRALLDMWLYLIEFSKTISWEDVKDFNKWFMNAPQNVKEYLKKVM